MNASEQHARDIVRPQRSVRRRGALVTASPAAPLPTREELDRLLVVVAAQRDRQAFALLFKHFAPRLKTFLLRSGLPAGVAEELAQETMISVWRKASSFDPTRAGASTWIFAIARHLRVDHLRRERLPRAGGPDMLEEEDDAPSGEALLLAAEREARVKGALRTLSDEQAAIVRLSFFNDKAHSEIARELGLPLGTVKSRVRLALGRLRALLDGET
ncbi:sigma-70 family RNA polymerase sigma factor [Chelatococcus reniformis]|uniref:RNA polymerase sigma factor n=1 Tax=Chelatococcus reniformis TaxID=1494448 RepID=A0A916UPB1_9HYPH|nr:sigma-70 family RNA polymerase sigma factor [Chelatococcus reniformis]GGC81352.1 RNA polymerase sigma factor [Chelatococcus reniformis]